MNILATVFPVFLMLVLGAFCNRSGLISQSGMDGIKTVVTTMMLPVVLFNALGTASYNAGTAIIVAVMALQLLVTLGLGFFMRPLLGQYQSSLPFIISGFEGGMMAYPLYSLLCGAENLPNIATIDIANTVYAFTLFTALVLSTGSRKGSSREILHNALSSPALYGVLLGLLFGITGLLPALIASPLGNLYQQTENILTCSVSAMILLSVGYDFNIDRSVLTACIKAVILRLAVQAGMLAIVWFLLRSYLSGAGMQSALILYAFVPPMFIASIYTKDPHSRVFVSTTISLYSVVSVIAFAILSVIS